MGSVFHSGDLGDIIFGLPVMRALGKVDLLYGDRPWNKPLTPRFHLIHSLLEKQPYISSIAQHDEQVIDLNMSTYRCMGYTYGETIASRQSRWTRIPINLSPWITVEPIPSERIIVNRCPRWHGFWFPWKELVEHYREEMLFIGLPEEHRAFTKQFGLVEYHQTRNLEEAAQIISGAEFYIGNQSCCNAIAEALHKPKLLEVCLMANDCIYPRPNSYFCHDGKVEIDVLGKKFSHPRFFENPNVVPAAPPPELALLEKCDELLAKLGVR